MLCVLCALCALLVSAPRPAYGEQVLAVQDHVGLMLPQGWKVNLLSQDPGAVILGINAPAFGISASFYIMRLETSPERSEEEIFKTFVQIDQATGLTPQDPTPKAPAHICPLRAAVLSNEDHAVIILSCKHPSASRLYLWRLEVPSNLMPDASRIITNFGNFVTANFVIFDPNTQQPLGKLPAGFVLPTPPTPTPPTTPPTDPTTPPTTPPTDPTTPPTTPP